MKTTSNYILGKSIKIIQPVNGYKSGMDAVLLSSMIEQHDPQKLLKIIDIGAGVGTISLSLLYRLHNVEVTALESDETYYDLLLKNKVANNCTNTLHTILGNIKDIYKNTLMQSLKHSYDYVAFNPPYYKINSKNQSPFMLKNTANMEVNASLSNFIDGAKFLLKPKSHFYAIYTAERLNDMLNTLKDKNCGDIVIYPIYSFLNKVAKRFIIKAKSNSNYSISIAAPMVIHDINGKYTKMATDILEQAKSYNQAINSML